MIVHIVKGALILFAAIGILFDVWVLLAGRLNKRNGADDAD